MIRFSAKKPMTIFVAVVVVIVLGVIALRGMTPDLLPNMDFPYVVIVTTYPGAAPESVESGVTRPIEQSMATLDGIESIDSNSSENYSMVVLQFQSDSDMDGIMVDILSKLDSLKSGFDDMVGAPYILRINPGMLPVEVAALELRDADIGELSQFATDTLIPELEGVTGVASVSAYGLLEKQVEVSINQRKIDAVNETLAAAINDSLADAKEELDDAQAELDDARTELEEGQDELEASQNSTYSGLAQAAQAIDSAVAQSAAYSAQITAAGAAKAALETELTLSQDGLAQTTAGLQSIGDGLTQVGGLRTMIGLVLAQGLPDDTPLSALPMLDETALTTLAGYGCTTIGDLAALDATLADQESELLAQQQTLLDTQASLTARIPEVETALTDLETELAALNAVNSQVQSAVSAAVDNYQTAEIGKMQAAAGFGSAAAQLAAGETALDSAQANIDSAMEQYNSSVDAALEQADIGGAVTLSTVSSILAAQDFAMPAGYVYDEGVSCIVSVGDELGSVKELETLLLFDPGIDGVEPVRLSDVADVAVTDNSGSIYARLNGEQGLLLTFTKQSSYPTAGVCDNLHACFDELSAQYDGLHFVSFVSQGDYIYEIIQSIFSSLLWGALFAVLVLLLFLRDLRPTFITLCSIPVSLLFALVLMYFSGVTLNLMSMAGLAVSVGMLVDNSIVVIENTHRLRRLGESKIKAAVSGAKQVAGAVAASTLTTICVFVPMAFSDGITRQLFTDMALTITYSLLASLFISLTLVPALSSTVLGAPPRSRRRGEHQGQPQKERLAAYRGALRWCLRHKAVPIALAVVLLAASAADVIGRGFSFLPDAASTQLSVSITMPEDASFAESVDYADQALAIIQDVDGVGTVGGLMSEGGQTISLTGGDGVSAYVTLEEGTSRSSREVVEEIDARCAGLPCTVTADDGSMMSSYSSVLGGSGIAVNVFANDLDTLQQSAERIAEALAAVDGVTESDSGIEDPSPELHFAVDREAAMSYGLTTAQVYQKIAEALTAEAETISLRFDGLDHSVIVRSVQEETLTPDYVRGLTLEVTDAKGEERSVRLGQIADISETQTLSTIARSGQRRYLSVTAAVAEGRSVTQVTAAAQTALEGLSLPQGVSYEFSGENESIMDAMRDLGTMLLVGMLLVYLIMVAQFQSLKSPFIVLLTIPLAFTGGLLGLIVCGMDLNILSMLGLIMLTGIIVNNGIVLVDYINLLRTEGMERREAVVEACATRLRPVLMTSLTTVMGLIVMALGRDESSMLIQPLAVVCIGGLLYGTLMTLFIVPVIYDLLNKKELRVVNEEDLTFTDK